MTEQFLNHIDRHQLFGPESRILVAVSGGIDSMTLLHLLQQSGFVITVAHANFQLRGVDSDEDEAFVKKQCEKLNVPFVSKRFTIDHASGRSVQMEARALRYTWFETLRSELAYSVIATAHSLNDNLETILFNLAKGTGFSGVTGIPVKHHNVVRPLLFASRDAIEKFAKENGIVWREDKSNFQDKYKRNFIRHHIVPALEQINPSLWETFQETSVRLQAAGYWLNEVLAEYERKIIISSTADEMILDQATLKRLPRPEVVLWELCKRFGFSFHQCELVLLHPHQPGKIFETNTHQLIIDRTQLILTKRKLLNNEQRLIHREDCQVTYCDISLSLSYHFRDAVVISSNSSEAYIDCDHLSFPLTIRPWREGDSFAPLGMRGRKKVSDYLIDEKIPLSQKQRTYVLESAGEIIWVIGYRLAEGVKVTSQTKQILKIAVKPLQKD